MTMGAQLLSKIPCLEIELFRHSILKKINDGGRIVALFGVPEGLFAVTASDKDSVLELLRSKPIKSYKSMTPEIPQAHAFEREIFEEWAILPEGHPWLKPVRSPCNDFSSIQGEEIHEVAVGPVHAGIIEPGHFRFQCHGERVLHLEIALGYQHRGVARELVGGPNKKTMALIETLAGDTTIGHGLAYCLNAESLSQSHVPPRADGLRVIALELERIANHIGDLGALAADVGYLPTASYCGRLRGDFLNLTALLCGNRLGRSFVRPGGVLFDLTSEKINICLEKINTSMKDAKAAMSLLWERPSAVSRFEGTGALSRKTCLDLGLVGPVARACGVARDVRKDFPFGTYKNFVVSVKTARGGDVLGRAVVRWEEVKESARLVTEILKQLSDRSITTSIANMSRVGILAPESVAVSLVEGWRGRICHVAITDKNGKFKTYKIIDPSFYNWFGLSVALRNQQISDFPLCNKSFNLSYCGHDL